VRRARKEKGMKAKERKVDLALQNLMIHHVTVHRVGDNLSDDGIEELHKGIVFRLTRLQIS